jgi:hypothetical protein
MIAVQPEIHVIEQEIPVFGTAMSIFENCIK